MKYLLGTIFAVAMAWCSIKQHGYKGYPVAVVFLLGAIMFLGQLISN